MFVQKIIFHTASCWSHVIVDVSHWWPDFISPQLWPPNSPDLNPVDYRIWSVLEERVYRTRIRDVDHLMTRLTEEWQLFDQQIIDQAIKQWRSRLRSCVREQGGHFEHQLWLNFIVYSCVTVCTRVLYARQVAHVGNSIFWVLRLKCKYLCQNHSNFFTNLQFCVNVVVVTGCKISKWFAKNWPSYAKVSRGPGFIRTRCST